MSDILIKNMKMPETCADCNFSTWNGFESVYCDVNAEFIPRKEWKEKRPDWCPIIGVPPHGRLIDADALLESIKEARKKDPEIEDVYIDDYFTVAEWVVSAPAIIEADGKDTNVTTKDGGT